MPDDIMDVYVDGITVLSNCRILTHVCNATVNVASSLIAVNLTNTLDPGYFIMSLGDGGCLTTMPWRCTATVHTKWKDLDFDDSAWPLAVAAPEATNAAIIYFNTSAISSTCPAINIENRFYLGNTYCRLWLN
jgi:hypothetical protein